MGQYILHKELLEIEFVQQSLQKQMHVTSNPDFAFHDDVFPAFAKNAAAQWRFPDSETTRFRNTIIPYDYFTSLEELNHISTIDIKLDGTDVFTFEIDSLENSRVSHQIKIIELISFEGFTLVRFGAYKNGSFWLDSDFFERRLLKSETKKLSHLKLHFNSNSTNLFFLDVSEEQLN